MNNKVGFKNDPQTRVGSVFCKSRVVDPLCKVKGKIRRLSEIQPRWIDILKTESLPKEYFLKFDR